MKQDRVTLLNGHILLQSHDRAADALALDPRTDKLHAINRPAGSDWFCHGWFVHRQNRVLALYRHADALYYRCGREWTIAVGDMTVCRGEQGIHHWLTFSRDGIPVATCQWFDSELRRRGFVPPDLDPTPFAEPEDFNWGIFVENVLSDGRRERIGRPQPEV